ncbi:MAG TPA: polymer-forming cytoskeletal protein [Candidatus Binataceae bacterium]|jgi:cytoskeletal protein CcmA (bactofilin family)|nr:polymer-forming cytoskeletal protein [Candidatus Binataceae bacterium]
MAVDQPPQNPAAKSGVTRNPLTTADAFRAPISSLPLAPGQAWIEERTRVAVSRNVNVSGKLVFQEPVRIEGSFRGEVSSSDLVVISEGGTVEGRVKTPRLLVLGELLGDIAGSKSVVLGPRSRVRGRIEAEQLTVCEGARLEGDLRVGHVVS